MGPTPDQLKEDIDRTRAELTANVDSLADRVSPKRIVQRKASSARTRATAVRDRVMGAASQSTGDTLSSGAGTVSSTTRDLPNRAAAGAQGNPLAAGLIAFGAGMLVASLLPETEAESHAAVQLRDRAGGSRPR